MSNSIQIESNLVARNTALYFTGPVLVGLIAVVSLPFIIRGSGAEAFGIFSLALVVLGYFSLFDLGLGRATTKFAAGCLGGQSQGRLASVVWTSLALQLLLGILGGIVLAAAVSVLVKDIFNMPAARRWKVSLNHECSQVWNSSTLLCKCRLRGLLLSESITVCGGGEYLQLIGGAFANCLRDIKVCAK